jgi:hypothetical protein
MLMLLSHPLIYRVGAECQDAVEVLHWSATLAPGHRVGLQLQELLHYEVIYI